MRNTLLLASAIAIVGCARKANDTKPSDTLATAAVPTPTPAVPFYELVGHHAENAYDYVKTSDWAAARASVDSLKTAVAAGQAQDTAGHGTDLRASVTSLDTSVAGQSRAQGLRDANHLTEIGAQLAAAHNPPVPTAVTLLDYYGRELEIGAERSDNAQLSRAASAIRTTWTKLRPQVVARGGATEAAAFDKVVASVRAARTPVQYAKTATPLLDQVDALEAVFTK